MHEDWGDILKYNCHRERGWDSHDEVAREGGNEFFDKICIVRDRKPSPMGR